MTNNSKYLIHSYSDSERRNLVEEYITRQKAEFTFNGVCSYIAYWAMEDGMRAGTNEIIYESNKIHPDDQERVRLALDAIVRDGRISALCDTYYKS